MPLPHIATPNSLPHPHRAAAERYLKYKLEELHAWVRLALGGSAAEAAEASLAGLAAIATFGLE